ncbi:MAG: hypothetical protein FJ293_14850 [Planctomycetes bacterium]|nr:hypothetical protein [Planctomycetota bacterium]
MKPWSLPRAALSAALLALLPCVARAQGDGLKGVIDDAELVETRTEIPRLLAAAAYEMKDGILDIELSEYAGYAGLVVANGGLEPNDASWFAKKHGFKVRIRLSEEESWSALNSGKIGASATTPDVLAAYGRQFQVVVPAQIGFSRGADGVVVRSEIKRINQLKGKVLAACQFTETDFFLRYLAQEAGLRVNLLADLAAAPDPEQVNMVYCADGPAAGDLFLRDLKAGRSRLAGCVTWAPKTGEVVDASNGKATLLTTNRNLLVIADVLVVNRGFAQQNPKVVAGLVEGLLDGNRQVRTAPDGHVALLARAFRWEPADVKGELAKVHLANLPENQAFFSGAIDAAGSFGGIYQSAVLAYGPSLLPNPADPDRFFDGQALAAAQASGAFASEKVAIAPISSGGGASVEGDPLLSKDIRFLFEPNSATLDQKNAQNLEDLGAIARLVQVSPGSMVLLRGHVDNSMLETFRKQGGEALVRQMALKAMQLSKERAGEIRRLLIERHKVDATRLEVVGRGWDEPTGKEAEQNRRVEVQWFTLE